MKFEDAQKKMITYLSSDDFTSREDAQDTKKSIDFLKQMIKKGYITENSQEGSHTKGFNKETKKYFEVEERAYVSGFMKKEQGLTFINTMNTNTDKVAFQIQPSQDNTVPDAKIGLTKQRSGTKLPLKGDFTIATSFRSSLPVKTIDFLRKHTHISKSENVIYVLCFDPVYGRQATKKDGLYQAILSSL
jgi:hypothetical protein